MQGNEPPQRNLPTFGKAKAMKKATPLYIPYHRDFPYDTLEEALESGIKMEMNYEHSPVPSNVGNDTFDVKDYIIL